MTYKRILVPIDGSSTSTKGLEEAARLASAKGCRVRLLHVIDQAIAFSTAETGAGTNLMLDVLRRSGKQALSTAEARARRKGIQCFCAQTAGFVTRDQNVRCSVHRGIESRLRCINTAAVRLF